MKIKAVLLTIIMSLIFWIGLNSSLEMDILVVGAIVATLISFLFTKSSILDDLKLTPSSLISLIIWIIVFLIELVKSNIDVMLRVISPKVRINPGIVEVKTSLKSKLGRLALANSITLTPGTLTTDIVDDKLYIHWIDATSTDLEGATNKIVKKFEKHLEVIFG